MGCFWVILVILVFLAIVLALRFWQRRAIRKKNNDDSKNPSPAANDSRNTGEWLLVIKDFLALYLIFWAIFLAYSIYRVLAVEFVPESTTGTVNVLPSTTPAATSGTPGQQAEGAPSPVAPRIVQIDPPALGSGSLPARITIIGDNFVDGHSKVSINGTLHDPEFKDKNHLSIYLERPEKGSPPAATTIEVINDGVRSNSIGVQIKTYGKLYWCSYEWDIGPEARLLLLVFLAGALGSLVHALQSLVDFIGNDSFKINWGWWYVARPFIGMALALIFYAALRGGMLAGTPSAVRDVNPYGVFTIAALAGMFSDKATQKLADIFEVLFRSDDNRKDKLKKVSIQTTELAKGDVGKPYSFQVVATGGTPPYDWTISQLPTGLTADAKGNISGKPAAAGEPMVKIQVKDSQGEIDNKELKMVITLNPPAAG